MPSPANRPRILVVIGSLQVGGTEQHLARVLPELVRRGWAVRVFALSGHGPLSGPMQQAGVTVHVTPFVERLLAGRFLPLRAVRLAAVTLHLLWVMRAARPDVVQYFLPESYLVGGLCALILGIRPRIMSRRSLNHYQRRRPLIARIERWLHRRMSLVTGNSRAVIRELENEGVPPSRLRLIYNGVAFPAAADDRIRIATRRSLAIAPETLLLVTVANLLPYKGHLDLLAALAAVADRMPADWRLICAGRDLGHGDALRRRCAELGLDGRVLWLGPRDDVARLLAAADIAVLASHEEGFSNAVLEAMAAGLPVVATDVGGNAEAVIEAETGFVVPARDPGRLGAALLRLAADPALRRRLGRAGRDRVAAHFTLDACIDSYEALYRDVGLTPRHAVSAAEPADVPAAAAIPQQRR